jgi:hypothetical protein
MPCLRYLACLVLALGCNAAAADELSSAGSQAGPSPSLLKTDNTRRPGLIALDPGPRSTTTEPAKDATLYVSAAPLEDFLARTEAGAHRWSAIAIAAAAANHIPPDFLLKLLAQESAFKPTAVSKAGALGIAQFMPGTAIAVGLRDPFEPVAAINAAAKHLAALHARFGSFGLAAAAYNAGPDRVGAWLSGQKGLPQETIDYVWRVTGVDIKTWAAKSKRAGLDLPVAAPSKAAKNAVSRGQTAKVVSAAELCQAINATGSACKVQRSY